MLVCLRVMSSNAQELLLILCLELYVMHAEITSGVLGIIWGSRVLTQVGCMQDKHSAISLQPQYLFSLICIVVEPGEYLSSYDI